jgi:hypothetical protein
VQAALCAVHGGAHGFFRAAAQAEPAQPRAKQCGKSHAHGPAKIIARFDAIEHEAAHLAEIVLESQDDNLFSRTAAANVVPQVGESHATRNAFQQEGIVEPLGGLGHQKDQRGMAENAACGQADEMA